MIPLQRSAEKFKNICFVTVSQTPNVDIIVEKLCESTGSSLPAFYNEADALHRLEVALKVAGQNPLLLVLDDVWPGSSDSLLDKCYNFKSPNYKILITSRSHFSRIRFSYQLQPLSDQDAKSLFLNTTCMQDSEFEALVTKIVELCKGFPFAITFIGSQLRYAPKEIWETKVAELSRGSSILDGEQLLLDSLQGSLDAWGKEAILAKECFIDLGSFPEDRRIPFAALIDMWAELHYPQTDSSSFVNLYAISTCNLATLILNRNAEECTDGYYSEHFVTQHDLLRDLAIHQIARDSTGHSKRLNINIYGNDIPEWWQNHESRPKMTSLLSISTDEAFSFKWDEMHLPKAKVLVLNLQSASYAFPKFKKKLSKSLKVLIVTNYGVLPAEVSNFTSLCYLSQLKRIRFERLSIPPITKDIKLKNLQKLSLFMCSMGQAIGNNGPIKFFEAFPSLEEINIDYCSDLKELPADICSLIHLRKLSITNCHKLSVLPKEIGELVNLELLRLRSCTDLVKFPDSVRRLKKLKVLDISHCVSIKEFPDHIGELGCLEKLNMRECSRLTELPDSVSELGSLIDVICDHQTIGLWELHMPDDLRKNMKIREVREIYSLDWLHQ